MYLSFLLPVWNFIKKYLWWGIIIIILYFSAKWAYNRITYLEKENQRKSENIKNKDFVFSMEKTKSGQLEYTVAALTVKANEMKYFSTDIIKRLEDMNLKIKNMQSISNVNYHYTTNIDTVQSKKIGENKYLVDWKDKNNSIYVNINTPVNNNPFLSDVVFETKDTLLIAPEYSYKRSWLFWKKLTGVKLHIKSENPNFKLDQVQTFQITK